MTSHKIGVNLRVSGNCNQGGRKYMEDTHSFRFYKTDGKDYDFAYFGIFDGHGGSEASRFARDNLLDEIIKYDCFWNDNDEDVQWAIKSGFLDTHNAMWKQLDKWPRRMSGYPSTAGTTCSVAFVRNSKIYIGHVGDSAIVLGSDIGKKNAIIMKADCLTKDHKPECPIEKKRIENSGGEVVAKSGVQRVVWNRPKWNHKGPIRRSTPIDKIPFLAVARSLGDLWSYDYSTEEFVVSPEPDVSVHPIDPSTNKCIILGSDGLWNMLSPEEAVSVVTDLEYHFEDRVVYDPTATVSYWINPAERLVSLALKKWKARNLRADNTSSIVVFIDPLGPSRLTILRKKREEHFSKIQGYKSADKEKFSTSVNDDSFNSKESPATPNCEPRPVILPNSAPPKLVPHKGDNCILSKSSNESHSNLDAAEKGNIKRARKLSLFPQIINSEMNDSIQAGSAATFAALSNPITPVKHGESKESSSENSEFSRFGALNIGMHSMRLRKSDSISSIKDSKTNKLSNQVNPGVLRSSSQNSVHVKGDRSPKSCPVLKKSGYENGHNIRLVTRLRVRDQNNSHSILLSAKNLPSKKLGNGTPSSSRKTLLKAKLVSRKAIIQNSAIQRTNKSFGGIKRKIEDSEDCPVSKRLRGSHP
ncbi:hypothetical protein SNE40_003178 [Patella caerulea]|uniref:PPM-type phosphatase domain-containing protein n=1 Tax=Patella caerulea TaxID=87958 RepID=A0AAN8QEW6_PATCE